MWFTLAAIKRPVAMTMVFVALGFLGVLAWFKLPKQLFPDTEIPVMSVSSVYPLSLIHISIVSMSPSVCGF